MPKPKLGTDIGDEELLENMLVGLIDGIKNCAKLDDKVSDEDYTECVYETYLCGMELRDALKNIMVEMRKSYGFSESHVMKWLNSADQNSRPDNLDPDQNSRPDNLDPDQNSKQEVKVENPLDPDQNSKQEVKVENPLDKQGPQNSGQEKPKRKRRTKAEMEAARLEAEIEPKKLEPKKKTKKSTA